MSLVGNDYEDRENSSHFFLHPYTYPFETLTTPHSNRDLAEM